MKVLFKKSDAAEPFSFVFTDDEGKVLLRSENYKARPSALNGIDSVKKNASSEKRYEHKTAKNGKVYFNLKATNGQIIGTSPMFDDEQSRSSAIGLLSSSATSAEVEDQSKVSTVKVQDTAKKVTSKSKSPLVTAKMSVKQDEMAQKSTAVKKVKAKTTISSDRTAKTVSDSSKDNSESSDAMMADIANEQLDATTETIISALNTLNTQLEKARESGSLRGKEIVKGLGGDSKMTKLIEDLAGYMGEAASAGMTMGSTPMIVMAGTAKGIYKKITE